MRISTKSKVNLAVSHYSLCYLWVYPACGQQRIGCMKQTVKIGVSARVVNVRDSSFGKVKPAVDDEDEDEDDDDD
jgi:hypothetical protein